MFTTRADHQVDNPGEPQTETHVMLQHGVVPSQWLRRNAVP